MASERREKSAPGGRGNGRMRSWESDLLARKTQRQIRALDNAEMALERLRQSADVGGLYSGALKRLAKYERDPCSAYPCCRSEMLQTLMGALHSLQSADAICDRHLKAAAIYTTVRECTDIIDRVCAVASHRLEDVMELAELAASSLSMLSARPDGREELRRGRTITALVRMFKPAMDDLILEHIGSALGNLANHAAARAAMKDSGLTGAVARLLRMQHRPRAQVAAAVCLALAAAKDLDIQESARYMGVVPQLVDMVACNGNVVAEVGRLALLSLRHRNPSAQAEILRELRLRDLLLDDLTRFCRTDSLLDLECSRVHRLMDDLEADLELSKRASNTPVKASLVDDLASSPRIRAMPRVPITTKALSCYTASDVSQLLYDLDVPVLDVQRLRDNLVDGAAIQGLSQIQMDLDFCLSPIAMSAVKQVQRASRLFNRLTRYAAQSRISELDVQVWLASAGLRTSVIRTLLQRFRSMSCRNDGMVSFAELCVNFPWFDDALKAAGAYL